MYYITFSKTNEKEKIMINVNKRRNIRTLLNKAENILFINNLILENNKHTMNSLTKEVCQEFEILAENGKYKYSSCLVILKELQFRMKITLVTDKKGYGGKQKMNRLNVDLELPQGIPETYSSKMDNDLDIILIDLYDTDTIKIWNELMITEHPLGEKRVIGRQLKYLVKYKELYIGAFSFSASAKNLGAREKWVGWNQEELSDNLHLVTNMSRFLIRKDIKCKNLASHLLSESLKRLKEDYKIRYNIKLMFVETFVDKDNFAGTCYKAANWEKIGETKGRGRNDRNNKKEKSIKDIYVYILEKEFVNYITDLQYRNAVSKYKAMELTDCISEDEWTESEFGNAIPQYEKLSDRLVVIANNKFQSPGSSYRKCVNGDINEQRNYENFIANKNDSLNFSSILSGHFHNTRNRMLGQNIVLALQDTCSLNYNSLNKTTGLGDISKNRGSAGTKGLALHSTFVVTPDGLPVGVFNAECTAPKIGENNKNKNRPIEEKESYRWIDQYLETIEFAKLAPNTQIITVMDREADMFELLEIAEKNREIAPILIRLKHNRLIANGDKLFNKLENANKSFETEITIPPQREKKATTKSEARPYLPERKAILEFSFMNIKMPTPSNLKRDKNENINMTCIYAKEKNPPKGAEKIGWKLCTTLKIKTPEDALKCIGYYKQRWKIEDFHRVMKSGFGVEKHKLSTADRLRKAIAIDMVMAWRIMLLTSLARKCPDIDADIIFTEDELFILKMIDKKKLQRK
jgi:hypothetical protein